jgi:hypothetical protein
VLAYVFLGCPLLSADENIAASGLVRVIWQ